MYMGRLLRTELVKASLPLGQIFTLPVTKGFSNRSSTFTFNQWAFDSSYSELEYPNISSERFLDYSKKFHIIDLVVLCISKTENFTLMQVYF
jgi:hypothetical protein